jgi:histidinol-phosphate aminotransferase
MRDRGFIARRVREVRRGRQELDRGLARLGVRTFPSGGNFLLVYFGERAKKIVAALERKGILVRDRSSDFGGEGYVRITVGTVDQTRHLLRELKELL